MSELHGRDLVATEDLYNKIGELVAAKGETCENVQPSSLPWLLKNRHIAPVEKAHAVTGAMTVPGEPAPAAGIADEPGDSQSGADNDDAPVVDENPPARRGRKGR